MNSGMETAQGERWLVRTAKNLVHGPYSRDQVCSLIQQGKVVIEDEVCRGNHYWIYLHEREEVLQQLGIEVPHHAGSDPDEITQTDTAFRLTTLIEPKAPASPPQPPAQGGAMAAMGAARAESEPGTLAPPRSEEEITQVLPELPGFAEEELKIALVEDTAMINNRALREFQMPKAPENAESPATQAAAETASEPVEKGTHASPEFFAPQISPEEENAGPSWLRIAIVLLLGAALAYAALKLR